MRNYSIRLTYHSLIRIFLLLCFLGLFIWGSIAAVTTISTRATAANDSRLSYRSVSVDTEDTLWSVAKENYTQEWGSISDYLKEIMRCNALTSEEITAGSSLIVPVYLPADTNTSGVSFVSDDKKENSKIK